MDRMQKVSRDYAQQSQNLDSTFPIRLLQGNILMPIPQIRKALEKLQARRVELNSVGMLDQTTDKLPKPLAITNESKKALSLYIEDNRSKLDVMSGIAAQLALLLGILNSRFENKRLCTDSSRGMYIVTAAHDEILPEQLSSGEQNELLLFYELIFRVPKGSLILVDEPEISLHPAWQKQFLSDLLRVAGDGELHAVLATHSPMIIGSRWNLVRELGVEKAE
jgi:ABC-type glutathione transport system ATPase component